MTEQLAERMVACGWVAAIVAGTLMALFALTRAFGFGPLNLTDAALLIGLAYGIYRRSRICAVLVLVYHALNLAALYGRAHYLPPNVVAVALAFAALYVLGIVGTFAHHAHRRTQPA